MLVSLVFHHFSCAKFTLSCFSQSHLLIEGLLGDTVEDSCLTRSLDNIELNTDDQQDSWCREVS